MSGWWNTNNNKCDNKYDCREIMMSRPTCTGVQESWIRAWCLRGSEPKPRICRHNPFIGLGFFQGIFFGAFLWTDSCCCGYTIVSLFVDRGRAADSMAQSSSRPKTCWRATPLFSPHAFEDTDKRKSKKTNTILPNCRHELQSLFLADISNRPYT